MNGLYIDESCHFQLPEEPQEQRESYELREEVIAPEREGMSQSSSSPEESHEYGDQNHPDMDESYDHLEHSQEEEKGKIY